MCHVSNCFDIDQFKINEIEKQTKNLEKKKEYIHKRKD